MKFEIFKVYLIIFFYLGFIVMLHWSWRRGFFLDKEVAVVGMFWSTCSINSCSSSSNLLTTTDVRKLNGLSKRYYSVCIELVTIFVFLLYKYFHLLAFFSSPSSLNKIEQEKHPQLVNMEKADSVGVWAAMLYAS